MSHEHQTVRSVTT